MKDGDLEFDIVDPPAPEEPKASEEDKMSIFESLLSGKEITTKVTTSRGDFSVKYPTGKDIQHIDRVRAVRRNGISADAFDNIANYNILVYATLDVVVKSGPAWYEKVKKEKPGFSFEGVPDSEFIDELYSRVLDFRGKMSERIKLDRNPPVSSTDTGPEKNVGDGAFSGLANRPENGKP